MESNGFASNDVFTNEENISEIQFTKQVHCVCPVAQDIYTGNIVVMFVPGDYYPEYINLEKWFDTKLEKATLTIEQLCYKIYKHLMDTIDPFQLRVEVRVTDAKHMPIVAIKTTPAAGNR